MARLLPQVPGMTYAHDDNELFITFFAESSTQVEFNGVPVAIEQATDYPNDGKIDISLNPAKPTTFRLKLRIPTWTQDQFIPGDLYRYADSGSGGIKLQVNGKTVDLHVVKGFTTIEREWKVGDTVTLTLPMPVRSNVCHPSVEANHNRLCFTRGPFVLCAEGVDNGGATQRFFFEKLPINIRSKSYETAVKYGSFIQTRVPGSTINNQGTSKRASVVLTPYYAWNNRGTSSMTVWFPRKKEMAVFDPNALPKESIFTQLSASYTSKLDTVNAIGDGKEPEWSSGNKVPRWTSRGQNGKPQWVEAQFEGTKAIRSIGVFWMQDNFDVKFPKSWTIEVSRDGQWVPFELYTTDRYDTRANQYNVVHPAAPLKCDAIRIKMTPQEEAAVGILELQVTFE